MSLHSPSVRSNTVGPLVYACVRVKRSPAQSVRSNQLTPSTGKQLLVCVKTSPHGVRAIEAESQDQQVRVCVVGIDVHVGLVKPRFLPSHLVAL